MVSFKQIAISALAAVGHVNATNSTTNMTNIAPSLVDIESMPGVVGAMYRPVIRSERSEIAVLVMHVEQDYTTFTACENLAIRGFTVLCANNDASKSGYMSDLAFEDIMSEVALGVEYLRNMSDVSHVVLLGHSGGGAMMSAYQNIAENGLSACQGSEKIYPCSDDMADLPAADGIMLMDANYGISTMMLLSLNPAIIDETSGLKINQSLNLYSTANGFSSEYASNYTTEFAKAFQSGVAARNERIIKYAEGRLAAINAGNGSFSDDETFYIPDAMYTGNNNKFFSQDTRYLSHTVHPWPLLHKNGSITNEIIHSVRVPSGHTDVSSSWGDGAVKTSIVRFLSTLAIRTTDDFSYNEDSFTGIQWNSSHLVPIGAVPGIKKPLLTMGMTGHWEYLNAEKIYLNSGSNDTSIAFVEGAQHTIDTCTACESYPGEYGNTTVTAFNFVAEWLSKPGRFL